MDISLVIPLLNEAESLDELNDWIHQVMTDHACSYELIMIDDGSTDGSWDKILELKSRNPAVKGVKFRRNYGKSAALQIGFQMAKGEVVVTMDADLQDNPEEIPEMRRMILEEGYDLVSGWKKKRYDPVLSKNLPSKLFNWAARSLSGIRLHDFNCGLKAYRNAVIKGIEVYGEMHRYIPVLAKSSGFPNIGEKVVQHQERKYGVTKFGMERFINGFLDLLSVSFVTRFAKKPMHLFGPGARQPGGRQCLFLYCTDLHDYRIAAVHWWLPGRTGFPFGFRQEPLPDRGRMLIPGAFPGR